MRVQVNGEWVELAENLSLQEILDRLGYQKQYVAVALNRRCVRRVELPNTQVADADEIEILVPQVGG
jgi:thiamine biosynthesis protein ThiS